MSTETHPRRAPRRRVRANGVKRWITHAGVSSLYIVFAVTDPAAGSRGVSAFLVEIGDEGVSFGPLERKLGTRGSPTREVRLSRPRPD